MCRQLLVQLAERVQDGAFAASCVDHGVTKVIALNPQELDVCPRQGILRILAEHEDARERGPGIVCGRHHLGAGEPLDGGALVLGERVRIHRLWEIFFLEAAQVEIRNRRVGDGSRIEGPVRLHVRHHGGKFCVRVVHATTCVSPWRP